MLIEATSQNSMGALRYAYKSSSRVASAVKRVARLVQNRLHVALQANRVHENERQARFGQRGLIPARCLAFAIVEVEQAQVLHLPETAGQFRRPAG